MNKRMKKRLETWLVIVSVFVACAVTAWFLARPLDVNFGIALLAAMILAYLLIFGVVEFFRYRLRRSAEKMTAAEREFLAQHDLEVRYAIPASDTASPRVTTLVGAVAVNGLVLPLMIGPLVLLQCIFDIHDALLSSLSLLLGLMLAWGWWSVGVTVWRWWATTHRGMPPDEVQWRGEEATLLWPKDHFFEKTELGNLLSGRQRKGA